MILTRTPTLRSCSMNYFFWNKGLSWCPGFMTVENPRVCVNNWFLIGNFPSHVSLPFWYPILGLPNTYQSHMLHVWYSIFTNIWEIFRANVGQYSSIFRHSGSHLGISTFSKRGVRHSTCRDLKDSEGKAQGGPPGPPTRRIRGVTHEGSRNEHHSMANMVVDVNPGLMNHGLLIRGVLLQ